LPEIADAKPSEGFIATLLGVFIFSTHSGIDSGESFGDWSLLRFDKKQLF
jgi:hypothetical protein